MIFSERIRQLRKEKHFSQQELGEKIGGDAQQISRYEKGKVVPSVEAMIKIAEVLDVSIDYLLIPGAQKNRSIIEDKEFAEELAQIQTLDEKDKASLRNIIDALLTKNKMKKLIGKDP